MLMLSRGFKGGTRMVRWAKEWSKMGGVIVMVIIGGYVEL